MNNNYDLIRFRGLKWGTNKVSLLFILALIIFHSCKTTDCALCDYDSGALYRVQMKDESNHDNVDTYYAPFLVDKKESKDLYLINCSGEKPFDLDKDEMSQFTKRNLIRVDTAEVKIIFQTSDSDQPPTVVSYKQLVGNNLGCNRYRKPFKFELRAMGAYRFSEENGITYVNELGEDYYPHKTVNFDRGGTTLMFGVETALLPRIKLFGDNKQNAFHLGLLTGLWPVDEGLFSPIAIHPRFTFNDQPIGLFGNCNALYLFGDLGTAMNLFDPSTFWDTNTSFFSSWFTGAGVGLDLWQKENRDLSFDLGYRYTSLVLPEDETLTDCLTENNVFADGISPFPKRNIGQVFLRVGFTW